MNVEPVLSYTGLAVALLLLGALLFHEHVGWRQIAGITLVTSR